MDPNQNSMTRPKTAPTLARATALHPEETDQDQRGEDRTTTHSRLGVATPIPSTAPSTEIAGVMTPSPYRSAAPNSPKRMSTRRVARQIALGMQQGQQRHDAAFAPVIRPHDDGQVLE